MKILLLLLLTAALYSSCCKCVLGSNNGFFRFVDAAGKDLVFGPSKIYNKDSIRFFYVVGTDTLVHRSVYYLPSGAQDSLIGVGFALNAKDTCFVSLGTGDVDTLILKYAQIGGGCCDESLDIYPIKYNTKPVDGKAVVTVTK